MCNIHSPFRKIEYTMTSLLALAKSMQPCLQPAMIDDIMRGDMRDLLKHALMSLISWPGQAYPRPANIFNAFSFYTSLADIRAVVLDYTPTPAHAEQSDGTAFSDNSVAVQTIANTLAAQKLASTSAGLADLHHLARNGVLLLNMCLTADASGKVHTFWAPYTAAILAKLRNVPIVVLSDSAECMASLQNASGPIMSSPPPTLYQHGKHIVNPAFATTPAFADAARHCGHPRLWASPDTLVPAPVATNPTTKPTPTPQKSVAAVRIPHAVAGVAAGTHIAGDDTVDKACVPPKTSSASPSTGTLAVYIVGTETACRVTYKFAAPTVVFAITDHSSLPDRGRAAELLCADIARNISRYAGLSMADIVDLLVSPTTDLIGNFPHTLTDVHFRVRVYSKIAGIGELLPYPCKRVSWRDSRKREKHHFLY